MLNAFFKKKSYEIDIMSDDRFGKQILSLFLKDMELIILRFQVINKRTLV